MFRSEEDHNMMLNLMALRAFASDTEIVAEAEMSTHVHQNVFTDVPLAYAGSLRMSYTKYFNAKYGRKGRFGEKYTYLLKVEGFYHQQVLLNYILRNGLHHGASATALGYKYCSVRALFAEALGYAPEASMPWSRQYMAAFLPRHSEFPDHFRMNAQGVFLRDSFMEIRRAEQYYATPRNFLYQMNRLTDETWMHDQEQDNTGVPITLEMVERADAQTLSQLLNNEYGRSFRRSRLQDMDVCRLLDKEIIPGYGVSSVYQLSFSQKQRIARQLSGEFHLKEAQIRRCLVME